MLTNGMPAVNDQPLRLAAVAELDRLRLLTCADAAELMSISERTLYRMAMNGDIPIVRIRSAVRFRPSDLEAWINKNAEKRP